MEPSLQDTNTTIKLIILFPILFLLVLIFTGSNIKFSFVRCRIIILGLCFSIAYTLSISDVLIFPKQNVIFSLENISQIWGYVCDIKVNLFKLIIYLFVTVLGVFGLAEFINKYGSKLDEESNLSKENGSKKNKSNLPKEYSIKIDNKVYSVKIIDEK